MSTVPPVTLALAPARDTMQDSLFSPRTMTVVGVIVAAHLAALFGLAHLNKPAPATIEPTTFTATIIPLPPAPQPTPALPKPQPEPPKPQVATATPPPKPRVQPKNTITQKAAPETPPAPTAPTAPAEPVKDAAPPAPVAPPVVAPAPSGPVEGLKVSCDERVPVYPTQSRRIGEEGTVQIRMIIDERGVVSSASVVKSSGFARLDQAAKDAALAIRCKPPVSGGRVVSAAAVKPYNFRISD
ncbi:energy transducer TonB [Pandoraea terrae]|uniref:Energy transducer TonB n=1 Tax=Pandoraea terrae TaxID=1537710 RepID=A0A5E4VGE3_9BURK|nr:energy transducer TonB [Pandoraea terrae]VVE10873.1 energy transducer TonB [Pandoraea terrae]